jgi:hypothetical protein
VTRGRSSRGTSGRRWWVGLLLALSCLVLPGCVEVPTNGPAEPIEGEAPPCQNCVNVDVAPPSYGDEPKAIVEGYLHATSIYQPNYKVAKQFLTRSAADKWSPEVGAQIYSGTPVQSGRSTVVLDGSLEGALGPDRSYTAKNEKHRWSFGMVKEDGQWRIGTPPPGLMVSDYYFSRFYTSYNLYFIGNATLVPDPIFLPSLPNQANVASVLMKALLNGPSRWLAPAVTSAIPEDTSLSVDSVTVQDRVAEVPLSDAVLKLNDRQRSLMAAQVVYTLKATDIDSVIFRVNQKAFRVPESDEDTFEVPVDKIDPNVVPVPPVVGESLYAVRGRASGGVHQFDGPLGAGKLSVDRLAVSVGNTDIAVVTDSGTTLRAGLTTTGDPAVRLQQKQNLLRPQYSRYGELWSIGDEGGRQHIWVFNGKKPVDVGAALLAAGRVTAFRISPDGTRLALVRRVNGRDELGLARIDRANSETITVDGWRPLDTTQPDSPGLTVIRDVAWVTAGNLLVLGATTAAGPAVPFEVSSDASTVTAPSEPNTGDGVQLAVLLGDTSTSVLVDTKGQLFRDDGAQWASVLGGCRTVAFPG